MSNFKDRIPAEELVLQLITLLNLGIILPGRPLLVELQGVVLKITLIQTAAIQILTQKKLNFTTDPEEAMGQTNLNRVLEEYAVQKLSVSRDSSS